MPDSFPPLSWGQPPFDERDLDALLSGETADTPLALRQVADALTALQAAPTQAELTGEAAIRAEFRSVVLDEAARTDGHPYAQVLSALTLDRGSRPPARHRSRRLAPARSRRVRRRGRRGIGRPGGALLGVAVLVLAVAAIAFTGSLPGPIQRLTHLSSNNSSAAAQPGSGRSSQGLTGAGTAAPRTGHPQKKHPVAHASPDASPTPPASTQAQVQAQARKDCITYYSYFLHRQPPGTWPAEQAVLAKLIKLANGSSHVLAYCASYVRGLFHGIAPWWVPTQLAPQPGAPNQTGAASQGDSQGAGNTGAERAHKSTVPVPAAP